jgi:NitT/TauT family transport system ATP-binding protein
MTMTGNAKRFPAVVSAAKADDPDPMKAAISLRAVDVAFPGEDGPVKAVSSIDLHIRKQEFVSIVGRSGCGKSTLLRVIAGLLTPSAGEVTVMGTSAAEARLYRSFGIVFQSNVMLPWLTAIENVRLPLEVVPPASIPPRYSPEDLLKMVGLDGQGSKYPRQLSGGMRRSRGRCRSIRQSCSWMNRSRRSMP